MNKTNPLECHHRSLNLTAGLFWPRLGWGGFLAIAELAPLNAEATPECHVS